MKKAKIKVTDMSKDPVITLTDEELSLACKLMQELMIKEVDEELAKKEIL